MTNPIRWGILGTGSIARSFATGLAAFAGLALEAGLAFALTTTFALATGFAFTTALGEAGLSLTTGAFGDRKTMLKRTWLS